MICHTVKFFQQLCNEILLKLSLFQQLLLVHTDNSVCNEIKYWVFIKREGKACFVQNIVSDPDLISNHVYIITLYIKNYILVNFTLCWNNRDGDQFIKNRKLSCCFFFEWYINRVCELISFELLVLFFTLVIQSRNKRLLFSLFGVLQWNFRIWIKPGFWDTYSEAFSVKWKPSICIKYEIIQNEVIK